MHLPTEKLPDLEALKATALERSLPYWSPKTAGEEKRVFYGGKNEFQFPPFNATPKQIQEGEIEVLECAVFLELRNGVSGVVLQASKRLVSVFEDKDIGLPFLIIYQGVEENSTNSNKSARWSVRPLSVDGSAKTIGQTRLQLEHQGE